MTNRCGSCGKPLSVLSITDEHLNKYCSNDCYTARITQDQLIEKANRGVAIRLPGGHTETCPVSNTRKQPIYEENPFPRRLSHD